MNDKIPNAANLKRGGRVKYRPHRGLLADAMAEMKTFNTVDEMLEYIASKYSDYLSKEDLSISDDLGKDHRIDWKETRHVCTKHFGSESYATPMCIGMCSIEEDDLIPCPFCGGEAYHHVDDYNIDVDTAEDKIKTMHFIMCRDCPALVCGETEEIARKNWNRRV